MTRWENGRKDAHRIAGGGATVLMLVVVIVSTAFFIGPARAAGTPGAAAVPSGSSEQWAFGGHASVSFSCQDASCFNDSSFHGSYSFRYYVGWVVIYTRTNVSATQTMIEGQAALNASAHLAFSETVNGATDSVSVGLSGAERSAGFTNLTTGSVTLTSPGSLTPQASPALAIMDAASLKSFNFSGSYSLQSPNGSGTAKFDLGGHESSSVAFAPSLGIVPVDPQPGDTWSAVAPFSASGSWVSGYSVSAGSALGGGIQESNWTTGSVARDGVLGVNGTDLGAVTLYDNYTDPPTSVTAQIIYLDFGSGAFGLSDGWLVVPSGLYAGILSSLGSTVGSSSSTSNETAYYQAGSGIVGAGLAGSASLPVGATGSGPIALSLQAGPEPVAVAQQQYSAITSPSGSSAGFPWGWFVAAVAIVVLALIGVVLLLRRSRGHRPPPTGWTPGPIPPPNVPDAPSWGAGSPPPPPSA